MGVTLISGEWWYGLSRGAGGNESVEVGLKQLGYPEADSSTTVGLPNANIVSLPRFSTCASL